MSTGLTKTPHPISKRLTGHLRMTSGATKLSNDLAMVINANAPTGHDGKPLKMITEVDGKVKKEEKINPMKMINVNEFYLFRK